MERYDFSYLNKLSNDIKLSFLKEIQKCYKKYNNITDINNCENSLRVEYHRQYEYNIKKQSIENEIKILENKN